MSGLVSFADACAAGVTRYRTGEPCVRGHVDDRLVSNRTCCACNREKVLRNYHANRATMLKNQAARRALPGAREANVAYLAQYRQQPGYRDRFNAWFSQKKKSDPVFDFAARARRLVTGAFARKNMTKMGRTEAILGCSIPEFRAHIERQFRDGMTWDNRSAWEIDHKLPMASAVTVEDILRLNHYSNLRPLWREDNRRKGARFDVVYD